MPVSIPGISTTGTSTFNIIEGSSATFSGNVTVGGTITYDDVTFLDSVGVATARSGLEIGAGSITTLITLGAATATTTTTSESNIDTFDASVFRSAQYQVQITQGSSYHVTTLNVLHDGSSVYLSEFGTIKTGSSLATFDADINSGNVRVRATPSSATSTVFKVSKTLTKVKTYKQFQSLGLINIKSIDCSNRKDSLRRHTVLDNKKEQQVVKLNLNQLNEQSSYPKKTWSTANSKKHSDLYTDENPKARFMDLGLRMLHC